MTTPEMVDYSTLVRPSSSSSVAAALFPFSWGKRRRPTAAFDGFPHAAPAVPLLTGRKHLLSAPAHGRCRPPAKFGRGHCQHAPYRRGRPGRCECVSLSARPRKPIPPVRAVRHRSSCPKFSSAPTRTPASTHRSACEGGPIPFRKVDIVATARPHPSWASWRSAKRTCSSRFIARGTALQFRGLLHS